MRIETIRLALTEPISHVLKWIGFLLVSACCEVSANENTGILHINVQLVCDYKIDTVNFFDFDSKRRQFVKKADTGIEHLTPILDKFIGKELINMGNKTYIYGYFLSIDEATDRVVPSPIGYTYIERTDVHCLSVSKLF